MFPKQRLYSLLSKRAVSSQQAPFSFKMKYAFAPPQIKALPIAAGTTDDDSYSYFPVRRIYCVGRNYADHAREMGGDPDREPPFFFSKPSDAVVPCGPSDNATIIPYPLATNNLHHEIELVIAIGTAGVKIPIEKAASHVFGYGVGIDLTRRDLQTTAKDRRRPWDSAKGFDMSAPVGPIYPVSSSIVDTATLTDATIWLAVNGEKRQSGKLADQIWSVPEVISILSHEFHLQPGDLILTGTPSGVGPVVAGDTITGGIDGLGEILVKIVERDD